MRRGRQGHRLRVGEGRILLFFHGHCPRQNRIALLIPNNQGRQHIGPLGGRRGGCELGWRRRGSMRHIWRGLAFFEQFAAKKAQTQAQRGAQRQDRLGGHAGHRKCRRSKCDARYMGFRCIWEKSPSLRLGREFGKLPLMPLFEFLCADCEKSSELLVRSSDCSGEKCPHCGSARMVKQLSRATPLGSAQGQVAAPECTGNPSACGLCP